MLFTLRFILGFVEAPSFPANARIAVMWFPKLERGRVTSLFASASYFAVGIFSPLAGWLVSRFGWPWPFFVLGRSGCLPRSMWRTGICTSRATIRRCRRRSSTISSPAGPWSTS